MGNGLMIQEKFDDAIKYYKRTIALNPQFIEAKTEISSIYIQQKKFDKAEFILKECESKNQNSPMILGKLGYLYLEQRKFEISEEYFRKSIYLLSEEKAQNKKDYAIIEENNETVHFYMGTDDSPDIYYNYACCLALQLKIDESMKFLRKAITLDSNLRDLAKKDPDFALIRSDSLFKILIEQ